jgi:uncharacterized protein YegL
MFIVSEELAVRANRDDLLTVFLFYLLVDVSGSMAGELDLLNKTIVSFREELQSDPILEDLTQFGILSFSTKAKIEVPLGNLAATTFGDNLLQVGGATNYGAAFQLLRETIEADVKHLKAAQSTWPEAEAFRYYRPAVFFLTDGVPTDSWQSAFESLKAYKNYPLFVPFGFREANVPVLRQLVYPQERSRLYLQKSGASASQVLREMMSAMMQSVRATAHSASVRPMHVLPGPAELGGNVEVQQYVGGDWVDM